MSTQISQQGFKIGSRILDENELKVLLPSYDNIFSQIEKFREEAKNISEVSSNAQMDFEEVFDLKKDYNNIFSILGGRGTGKTSAAVTVRHRILNNSEGKEVIMPLIVPDDMGEVSDTLGWIITYIGEKIKILVDEYLDFIKSKEKDKDYGNKYTKLYDKYCRKEQELDLNIIFRRVHKAYHFRKEAYQKILAQEYVGKNEYVDETKEALESDQNLIKNFFLLIEEIIKVKSVLNNNDEPLIYFFFDDVDISAKRGPDVLSTTMRYLTHPNIVTFICGDYKVFSEMLTIDFLQKENLLDSELMEKVYAPHDENDIENYTLGIENTALNLRKIRGYDYLKKMLPSALRYEMPKLSDESKANFRYTKNSSSESDHVKPSENITKSNINKELSLIQLIENNLYTQEELINGMSFLKYKGNVVYSYFSIFDSTPRGLINPYYFLYQMLQDKEEEKNVWTSSSIKQLLDIIISSSLLLGDYRELINKIIRIVIKAEDKEYTINNGQIVYNKIEYYIDYNYLESIFDGVLNKKEGDGPKDNDIFILLFILAHFFENILVAINKKRNIEAVNLHGAKLLCKILNSLNLEGNLYPQISNVSRLLYIHYLLNKNISRTNSIKIFRDEEQRYFVWKYYDNVLKLLSSHEKEENSSKSEKDLLYNLFENIYREDREWVKKKIKQMFEYGMTNPKILMDTKKDFKSKFINLGTQKDDILNGTQLKKFNTDIENKISRESNKSWTCKNINYIYKLKEIINDIEKKNKLEGKLDVPYEDLLEESKDLFIEKQHQEETLQHLDNYKDRLFKCEKEINRIEDMFGQPLKNIIQNISNIHSRVKSLENLLEINNAPIIMKDMFEDIKYVAFDDANSLSIYSSKMLLDKDSMQRWENLYFFNAQNIADKYGVMLADKIPSPVGFLELNKTRQISNEFKEILMSYYANQEELRLLKNYILPESAKDINRYERMIEEQFELKKDVARIELEINDIKTVDRKTINHLRRYINLQEDTLDKSKVKQIITDINLSIIKREVTRIFKYRISGRDENDRLEVAKSLINLYEDIIDESYEIILNNLEEFYVVLTDVIKQELQYLKSKNISDLMDHKINRLLNYGDYVDQMVVESFVAYAKKIITHRENVILYPDIKSTIRRIIDLLQHADLKKMEHNDIFEVENANENISFVLVDYIKLCTLSKIIKVESNSASKKLREEALNLIGSNIVSEKNKFSSFKRFIESLQQ